MPYTRGLDLRTLDTVSGSSEIDFVHLIHDLKKRFTTSKIRVLYEGAGFSTFPEELEKACQILKLPVEVWRTDLYTPERYARMAQKINRTKAIQKQNVRINLERYRQATPETVHEVFGPDFFHLVVSHLGGMMYTPLSQEKGLAALLSTVKKGGEAIIVTAQNSDGKAMDTVDYYNREQASGVGTFLSQNPNIHFRQNWAKSRFHDSQLSRFRIRKGMPFSNREEIWRRTWN